MTGGSPRDRWDGIYSSQEAVTEVLPPLDVVRAWTPSLPSGPDVTGIDIAGGSGKHAIWLAEHGIAMTVLDVSAVGLAQAQARGQARGLDISIDLCDLETENLPDGQWDVILKTYFLNREVLLQLGARLRPGGVLVFVQPTVTNLERHGRPSERFLLRAGEIVELAEGLSEGAPGIEILECSEAWRSNDIHEAHLVLRRLAG